MLLWRKKMNNARLSTPERLIDGYHICASSEGKSPNSIEAVTCSVKYFQRYLANQPDSIKLTEVTRQEIRGFIAYLQKARCFSTHRFTPAQDKYLSGHTINCYVRSLRIFYSWLVSEDIITTNPYDGVKIPPPPVKVIPAFSGSQIDQLLKVVNKKSASGYRDFAIILTFLDTGIRVSELCSMKTENLHLEEGIGTVQGKGNKERVFFIGKQLQRVLWYYIERYRSEPATPKYNFVFLNREGKPLKRGMVEQMMKRYGQKAKLIGIRCSPHTLRHTAAISFLRNGGDLFSLQRILGHSSLEMTRRYCAVTDIDVKRIHTTASPVDNLTLPVSIYNRVK
jgi:site-specific recombinase XerD